MARLTQITVYLPSGKEMAKLKLRGQKNDPQVPAWIKAADKFVNSIVQDTVWGYFDQLAGSIGQKGDKTCWVYSDRVKKVTFLELLNDEGGGIESSPSSPAVAALLELEFAEYDDFWGFISPLTKTARARGMAKYAGKVTWTADSRFY